MSTFYTSNNSIIEKYRGSGKTMSFAANTQDEFYRWKETLVVQLKSLYGFQYLETTDPRPIFFEKFVEDDIIKEKVVIFTEKEVQMPFYILYPPNYHAAERYPAIIATHGHSSGGKSAVAGVTEGKEILKKQIDIYNYAYGVELAKQGYLVFCPDARGFGERREHDLQKEGQELESSCNYLNNIAITMGLSLAGLWAWDLTRLLDYIESRSDVDKNRMGCAGLSGGGWQTLLLGSIDSRIKAAVVSGLYYGFEESILQMSQCSCNYVPGLYRLIDIGDLGAMFAPRALLIETGNQDSLNGASGLQNVYPQVQSAQRAMDLLGVSNHLHHHVFSGGHKWDGSKTESFLRDYL